MTLIYWHKRLALWLGLFIMLISLSGITLVYKHAIISALIADQHIEPDQLSLTSMGEQLDKLYLDWGANNIDYIKAPNNEEK